MEVLTCDLMDSIFDGHINTPARVHNDQHAISCSATTCGPSLGLLRGRFPEHKWGGMRGRLGPQRAAWAVACLHVKDGDRIVEVGEQVGAEGQHPGARPRSEQGGGSGGGGSGGGREAAGGGGRPRGKGKTQAARGDHGAERSRQRDSKGTQRHCGGPGERRQTGQETAGHLLHWGVAVSRGGKLSGRMACWVWRVRPWGP
jgi:hypothetical protein